MLDTYLHYELATKESDPWHEWIVGAVIHEIGKCRTGHGLVVDLGYAKTEVVADTGRSYIRM